MKIDIEELEKYDKKDLDSLLIPLNKEGFSFMRIKMQMNENSFLNKNIDETPNNTSKIVKKLLAYQIIPIIHYIIEYPFCCLKTIICKQILQFNKKDIKLEKVLFSFYLIFPQKEKISQKEFLSPFIKIIGNSLPLGIMGIYVYFHKN